MKCEVSQKNLFVTLDEARRIFSSIRPGEVKYRILLLLVAHGCRPCEAVKLNIADFIDDTCRKFYVTNTKVAYNGRQPRRDLKVLPLWVAEAVKWYITEAYSLGLLRQGYLFPTDRPSKRSHMHQRSLNAWFCKRRRELGLTEIVGWNKGSNAGQFRVQVYSLRRLFATELVAAGVKLEEVALLMGHNSIDITMGYVSKRRLFEQAEVSVAKMPRFMAAGQLRLSAYT